VTTVGYIGGYGRSGSTLLETILAGFDDTCVLGEIVHLWTRGVGQNLPCGCGQRFAVCPFWQEVGDVAFGGWRADDAADMRRLQYRVDRNRRIPAALARGADSTHGADIREYTARFAAVYEAAAKITGARVVIDSSKHAPTAFVLRREPRIDLRVVHLVRDSRGVAYSWTKQLEYAQTEEGRVIPMPRYAPWRAALEWGEQNLYFDTLARTSSAVWRLRYEDLLAAPVETTYQLATYLGLPTDSIVDFVSTTAVEQRNTDTHQISGNPIRFQAGPLELRSDAAWRTDLPVNDRRTVTALTVLQMWRYGYFGPHRRNDG
jgi:hypothetical protein